MTLDVVRPEDCDFDLLDFRGYPGVPVDWDECTLCKGSGLSRKGIRTCPRCEGFKSLKAAALWVCLEREQHDGVKVRHPSPAGDRMLADARCQECQHPMGEDVWEHTDHAHKLRATVAPVPSFPREKFATALRVLSQGGFDGTFATEGFYTHYSRCNEKCRHNGLSVRWHVKGQGWIPGDLTTCNMGEHIREVRETDKTIPWREGEQYEVEASWRQVDVRPLGHPCDLRPHMLGILCLRCYAESFQRAQSASA